MKYNLKTSNTIYMLSMLGVVIPQTTRQLEVCIQHLWLCVRQFTVTNSLIKLLTSQINSLFHPLMMYDIPWIAILVTRLVIRTSWFILVTGWLMKIIGELLHSWPKKMLCFDRLMNKTTNITEVITSRGLDLWDIFVSEWVTWCPKLLFRDWTANSGIYEYKNSEKRRSRQNTSGWRGCRILEIRMVTVHTVLADHSPLYLFFNC